MFHHRKRTKRDRCPRETATLHDKSNSAGGHERTTRGVSSIAMKLYRAMSRISVYPNEMTFDSRRNSLGGISLALSLLGFDSEGRERKLRENERETQSDRAERRGGGG